MAKQIIIATASSLMSVAILASVVFVAVGYADGSPPTPAKSAVSPFQV